MLVPILLCLGAAASVAVCDGNSALEAKYSYSLELSGGNYELYWSFDPANENVSIAVRVKTLGWVGLGVSERGGMENADIVTGQVVNGNAELMDRFATTRGLPSSDTLQNWYLIGGSENDGWTTLEFWRYLDTGDADEDRVITETFNPVIFAWGTTDTLAYHSTSRGSQAVNFVQGDMGPSVPSGAQTMQLLVQNVTIPDQGPHYWCQGFTLPEEIRSDTKHIIRYSPVIHVPASAHVNVMLLFTCDGSGIDTFTDEQLSGSECFRLGGDVSEPKLRCLQGNLVAAWAEGISDFYYPEDVSFSFGGPDSSSYMVLEIHYENPNGVSGVIDNSGFEITYVDDARCFDAGFMIQGSAVFPTMVIPPGQDNFDVFGVCHASCSQNFPAEGITIFANAPSTHSAGHGITLKHYRNGVEISPPIDQDLNYNFTINQHRSVTQRKVMPGDDLELKCSYRTADRTVTTFGGLSANQETCLSFIAYYPRATVTECQSALFLRTFAADLRLDEAGVNLNQSDDGLFGPLFEEVTVALSSPSFPWNESRIDALSNRYMNARSDVDEAYEYRCIVNQDVLWTPTAAEVPQCQLGGGAAVLRLSGGVLLLMTAVAAYLLLA